MEGERFEAHQETMVNMTPEQIEQKGYDEGKKYVAENFDKTFNFGITGKDYLKGFLRGAEEQYNEMQPQIEPQQPGGRGIN